MNGTKGRVFLALEVGKKLRRRHAQKELNTFVGFQRATRETKRTKAETKQKEAEIVVWAELKKVLG